MASEVPETEKPQWKCGIVRPIAEMDGCSAQHWSDVHSIMADTLESVGFTTRLVSDADEIGVIQGRIVKNLYEADLVVCDVSGKNPNVMFELGLRLAFDKPTIVIKDDVTSYSFDTSPIEHIPYPRDLRYTSMLDFKDQLARKAVATAKAPADPNYKSFLQHFGPIRVPVLDHQEVPADQFILDELREMKSAISRMSNVMVHDGIPWTAKTPRSISRSFNVDALTEAEIMMVMREVGGLKGVKITAPNITATNQTLNVIFESPASASHAGYMIEQIIAHMRARPQAD